MSKETIIKRTITILSLTIITCSSCFFLFAFYKTILLFGVISVSDKKETDSNKVVLKNREQTEVLKQFKDELSYSNNKINKTSAHNDKKSPAESNINLYLLGTITGSKTSSTAIINDPATGKQSFYKIGDKIKGATLTQIFRNKVALDIDGREEFLALKKQSDESVPENVSSETERIDETKPRFKDDESKEIERLTKRIDNLKESIPVKSNEKIEINSKSIESCFADRTAAEKMKTTDVFENQKFVGLKLDKVTGGSFWELLGLTENDIIIGINGKKLNRKEAERIIIYLTQMPHISLQFKRNDEIQSKEYTMK
ncbi:MAG: hypothetical protein HQK78_14025 [Desulfobacterales bacterium]|nr:hypothetical protein [Desulfobacterales bacterium]